MNESSPEVFIIDDDEAVRDSLELLFSSVGLNSRVYQDAADFLAHPPQSCIGCIVTDVRMPNISGLKLVEQLDDIGVILPVIFITGYADVAMAVEAMKLGAVDFLEKPVNQQALIECVQSAIDKSVKMTEVCCRSRDAQLQLATLTERERGVAELMAQGRRSKEIARDLGISNKTVEVHRHNVLNKLAVGSPVDVLKLFNDAETTNTTCAASERRSKIAALIETPDTVT